MARSIKKKGYFGHAVFKRFAIPDVGISERNFRKMHKIKL
jgi:hypothetical protein